MGRRWKIWVVTIIATVIRVFPSCWRSPQSRECVGAMGEGEKQEEAKLLRMLGKYTVLCEQFKTNKHL